MKEKQQSDFKLVRVSRNVANKLSKHISRLNNRNGAMQVSAGRWLDQAVLEKVAREQAKK